MNQSSGGSGGGEVAAKRPNLSSSGEDHLSALPDDIIVLILLRLHTITEAARTSVLSRRWRRIWRLLPELTFRSAPDDRHILEVLASSEAPVLHEIYVVTEHDIPRYVADWLPLAAPRLSGALQYHNRHTVPEEEEMDGAVPLPCFGNATAIKLDLGFLALALPSSGEFTRLTELGLDRVRFQGTCELSDVISSPRCPGLRILSLRHTWGLLKINASALKNLTLHKSFLRNRPIANILAPQLESLQWRDAYDPSSVELGNLGQLQRLGTYFFVVYGQHGNRHNRDFLWLLHKFQFIYSLRIALSYPKEIGDFQYLMEDIKGLPNIAFLHMFVINHGHTFGASAFHVLRLCTGIKRLSLHLHTSVDLEAQSTCPPGCICGELTNWKTEELSLSCLQEVQITGMRGDEHEVAYLKQLLNWAVMLKKLKITFDSSVSKCKAKELFERLPSISRLETLNEFCMYGYPGLWSVELLLLEDEGTGV